MNNKILVKIEVPELNKSFDVFIPVNELVWKINKIVLKAVSDISETNIDIKQNYIFINKITNKVYKSNEVIIDTDIRNGTELILIK